MNHKWGFWFNIIAVIVVILAIYLAYINWEWVKTINPTIVAAFVASITGVFGYWYTQKQTTSRQIAESHRPNKILLYEKFMHLLEYIMLANREPKKKFDPDNPTKDETKMYQEITRGLLVWGSPNLIKKWLGFRRLSKQTDLPAGTSLRAMDEVFQAFRNELGSSNEGLESGDLIRLFLKDPDEIKIPEVPKKVSP